MGIIKQYIYRIDQDDVIRFVDQNWLQFALENDSPHLTYDTVVGTSLWSYVTDAETVQIYKAMFNRVRNDQITVSVPYRCDSPDCRRYLHLEIHPLPDEHIEFHSHLLREEKRKRQPLLDPSYSRSEEYLRMCSWCKKIYLPDQTWEDVEKAVTALNLFELSHIPQITHAICPTCIDIFFSDVDEFQEHACERFEAYTGITKN